MIQSGTLARQRTVVATLADLPDRVAEAGIGPPALLVVGEVVARRPALGLVRGAPPVRPADRGHPAGRRVRPIGRGPGSPRGRGPARPRRSGSSRSTTSGRSTTRSAGSARSTGWPSPRATASATSSTGSKPRGRDLRALGHLKLAAIGPATAEALARYRLRADLVPDSYRSEALAEALAGRVAGRRVLLARADRGRTILKDELGRVADVEQVAVYRNADAEAIPPEVLARIEEGSVDWITLTSSAIAERLHGLLPESARRRVGREIRLASLSPVTTSARSRGWAGRSRAEAEVYTWDGLVEAITSRGGRPKPIDPSDRPPRAQRSSREVSNPCQSTNAAPRMNRMSSTMLWPPKIWATMSSRNSTATRPAMPIAP